MTLLIINKGNWIVSATLTVANCSWPLANADFTIAEGDGT